jgi:hypothetical protein
MNLTKDQIIIFFLSTIIIFLTYKNNVWYKAYIKCVILHRSRDNYIKKINDLI